jgi:hypothetical protein
MFCCTDEPEIDIEHYYVNGSAEDVIPPEFKDQIVRRIILPYYRKNIEYTVKSKTTWSRISVAFLTTSTLMIGSASILSFASGVYMDKGLNFVAGSLGLIALVCKEFASYANNLDHVKTLTMNDLMKNVGIHHSFSDTSKLTHSMLQNTDLSSMPRFRTAPDASHPDVESQTPPPYTGETRVHITPIVPEPSVSEFDVDTEE